MKPIDNKLAESCFKAFDRHFPTSPQKITTGALFDTDELAEWLGKIASNSPKVMVRFGMYTQDYTLQKEDEGRMTAFFCPCDEKGNPATDEEGKMLLPVNQGVPQP